MSLTGDWAKLRAAIAELQTVDTKAVRKVERAAHDEVEQQYRGDFASQRDPWGNAWPATVLGKSPVLVASGALANAAVQLSGGSIRIRPPRYWIFHQAGANGMKNRAVLPFAESSWDQPIQARIGDIVIGHFSTAD